jgi:hypothetical protein
MAELGDHAHTLEVEVDGSGIVLREMAIGD